MTAGTGRAARSGRRTSLLVGVVAVVVALLAALTVAGVRSGSGDPGPAAAPDLSTQDATSAFFDAYVDADGRVVRRDQGADTVSEGQAYGMLLAVAVRDEDRFDAVWAWTRSHLLQPSGLLAWRWQGGAVVDPQPATDADLDAVTALLTAARVFDRPTLHQQGVALAGAVLTLGTLPATDGVPADGGPTNAVPAAGRLLVAGPWARQDPAVVNPSYLAPGTARGYAARTGDARWEAVADTQQALLDTLLGSPAQRLPPDWARVPAPQGVARVGQAVPTGPPDGSTGPLYGYDAPRLLVRLASSCAAADRRAAADLGERLGQRPLPALLDLDGGGRADYEQPLGLVAAASAAQAAGDGPGRDALLRRASALPAATDTYYGAAWVALGRALLTPSPLTTCDPGAST